MLPFSTGEGAGGWGFFLIPQKPILGLIPPKNLPFNKFSEYYFEFTFLLIKFEIDES